MVTVFLREDVRIQIAATALDAQLNGVPAIKLLSWTRRRALVRSSAHGWQSSQGR